MLTIKGVSEDLKNLLKWVKEYDLDVAKYKADNWDKNQDNPYYIVDWLIGWGFDSAEASRIEAYYSE